MPSQTIFQGVLQQQKTLLLPMVNITVLKTSKGANTTESGTYEIDTIKPNSYVLK